jgi:DNA-binding SARP family transcriptional activator
LTDTPNPHERASSLHPPRRLHRSVTLRCWGEFRLLDRLGGHDVSPRGRKARAIIAYLAAQVTSVSRERLAGLLWSERGDEQARASLRQTLIELRAYPDLMIVDRNQARPNVHAWTSDIADLEELARTDRLEALSEALAEKGDLLYEGLDGLDPAFDEWLSLERRHQQDRLLSHILAAAVRGLNSGAFGPVSDLATQLQALDPTHEEVAQVGMKADQARGDLSSMRQRYKRLCEALKQEFGVEPSQGAKAVFAEMASRTSALSMQNDPATSKHSNAAPRPDRTRPAIAILPLADRLDLAAHMTFASNLAEDLTVALSANPWVKVLASRVTARHMAGDRDLRRIGADLDARYILESNVRQIGDSLRVTVQLTDAESGRILWAQKFERAMARLSAEQEDLVAEIAAHLGVQVHRAEIARAPERPTNASVWDVLKRVHVHSVHATYAGWEAAANEAKHAVEINPNDGEAYAHLAGMQGCVLIHRGGHDPELAKDLANSIRRAQTLGPDIPLVHTGIAQGFVALGRLEDALCAAERAITVSPHFELGYLVRGQVLVRIGRLEEGISELRAVERLSPNGIWVFHSYLWQAIAHFQAGRLSQALQAAERAVNVLPTAESLTQHALCLAKLDKWDGARDTLRSLRESEGEVTWKQIENLIRDHHRASSAMDEYVDLAHKIWDWDAMPQARQS